MVFAAFTMVFVSSTMVLVTFTMVFAVQKIFPILDYPFSDAEPTGIVSYVYAIF
jgi:hypothetical protein